MLHPTRLLTAMLLLASFAPAQTTPPGWWMTEPLRWFQTNLRETDAAWNPQKLVNEMATFHVNVLHINVGGIVAFYPTAMEFHQKSPHLPAGVDFIGDVVREAHDRKIRVVGRFDLSKTHKPVYDAHPEWFFRQANGDPVVYNGLYSTCINGGYYRDYAMRILAEALDRYELDGLFFNMFGNQSRDYSGRPVGLCHCDACKRMYRERFKKDLPERPDADYQQFMFDTSREVAAEIGKLIHAKRPNAGYFNYIQEYTDGIMSESNTAVDRPLPLWPYQSSDNVDRARNSQPSKMSVNLNMQFVDFPWRFATVPTGEIALRLWQNVAHGGAAAFVINGSTALQDRQAMETARPIYQWLAENEQYYGGQTSLARVMLLTNGPTSSYRGLFRLLSEQHIPFAVSTNLDWIGKRDFDLVISVGRAPAELEAYMNNGGNVLLVSPTEPAFPAAKVVKRWEDVQGYLRVRDHKMFASLNQVDLLMLDGDYLELEPQASMPPLTLVPPSMFGPPEKIHLDLQDTEKPGILMRRYGKGTLTWIPWDAGTLYYRHSLNAHAGLLADVIDRMLIGRQIQTDAHPLVEMTLMRQGENTIVHMVNLSGHSSTGYFKPIPTGPIRIKVAGQFRTAKLIRSAGGLGVTTEGGYSVVTVPQLDDYEAVVLSTASGRGRY